MTTFVDLDTHEINTLVTESSVKYNDKILQVQPYVLYILTSVWSAQHPNAGRNKNDPK